MKKLQAFSLIEVLVFTAILGFFFVFAASVAISIVRDMKINQHKILATRYASEFSEWLIGEKETNWDTFSSYFSSGEEICFQTLAWSHDGRPCDLIDSKYERFAEFTKQGNDQITVVISVSWSDLGKNNLITISKSFKPWE